MELLSYINSLQRRLDEDIITIKVNHFSYNISRETQPVFSMGSSSALFVGGPTVYTVYFESKDEICPSIKDGQAITLITDYYNDKVISITVQAPRYNYKKACINFGEITYKYSLTADCISVHNDFD